MENIRTFLRTIRAKNDENGIQMAKTLGINRSYLSLIESGKRRMSCNLYHRICQKYRLSNEEQVRFARLALNNDGKILIDVRDMPEEKKLLVESLAGMISELSEGDVRQLQKIISSAENQI